MPVDGSVAAREQRWRQWLTWALGLVWLLDAGLQYQPYMFTTAFPNEAIAPAGAGSPAWVHGPVLWAAHLMAHHIVVLNALFATVQLAIAIGLFVRPLVKLALAGSILWALLVWWLGEGLGGILAGPASPVMGLPGAVILYAFIAVLVWPTDRDGGSVADASPLGSVGARAIWVVLWVGFAVEALLPANRAPSALHDMITGMGDGEPGWVVSVDRWGAGLVDGRGTSVAIVLAVCFAFIALSGVLPVIARPAIVLVIVLAIAIWVLAQDFGELATGDATDPNSAPLLALLALCFWPMRAGATRARATRAGPAPARATPVGTAAAEAA